MRVDGWVLAAIVGMAIATYATRAGGYLLFSLISPSPAVRKALGYLPGALFVSYVVPALAQGRLPEWCGAVATVLIMMGTRQMAAAVLGGTAVTWVVWSWA